MNKGLRDTPQSRTSTEASREGHEAAFGEFKSQGHGKKTYKMIDGVLTLVHQSRSVNQSAYVMGDITPHQSTITGEMVTTRSRHRQILKDSGCVEVGNEDMGKHTPKRDTRSKGVREDLAKTLSDYGI